MKKYKIFYIDDQSFALPQLVRAIPSYIDYELVYVQRIGDIVIDEYDLVLLDFYLDRDNTTALDIVGKFEGMTIISFSTCENKNRFMLGRGAQYGVKKIKENNNNSVLQEVLKNIFPKT